jgi:hypothetical protein
LKRCGCFGAYDLISFYAGVDDLIKKCQQGGFAEFATKLKTAKASGFTSGEILGEIGLVLREFKTQEDDGTIDLDVKKLTEFVEQSLG